MKTKFITFIMLCVVSTTTAQEVTTGNSHLSTPYQRRVHVDIGLGANFDLASFSKTHPADQLFGVRPRTVAAINWRLSYLAWQRWGWYANIRAKIFHRGENKEWNNGFFEAFGKALGEAVFPFRFAASGGAVYRIEHGRWQCYPRAGVGTSVYIGNRSTNHENDDELLRSCKTQEWTLCLDFGVTTAFRLSNVCALFVDVSYQQPLTRATSKLIVKEDKDLHTYRASNGTLNTELTVSAGISLQCNLSR